MNQSQNTILKSRRTFRSNVTCLLSYQSRTDARKRAPLISDALGVTEGKREMSAAPELIHRRRQVLRNIFFVLALSGCATTMRVDHSLEIKKVGKENITDVTLIYGEVRPMHARVLGIGGGGRTAAMMIPESATVKWSTEDGQTHEVVVPIRSKTPLIMEGRIVSFEIHDSNLKVFIDRRLPDFKRERTQIYGP
jgi:hypothetical protein